MKTTSITCIFFLCILLMSCSRSPVEVFDNQEAYTVRVLNNGTKQPEADVPITFQSYFTGTFGRAYLLETEGVTTADGKVSFDLNYDDELAQQLRDSVESVSEDPLFQISIDNGGYIVWRIYDQTGEAFPPVIINREIPAETELAYEAGKVAPIEFVMVDTLNPDLLDEVRIYLREIAPVGTDTLSQSLTYVDFTNSNNLGVVAAGSDTEIFWEVFEGPDQNSLQKVREGTDTVNVPFQSMLSYTLYH